MTVAEKKSAIGDIITHTFLYFEMEAQSISVTDRLLLSKLVEGCRLLGVVSPSTESSDLNSGVKNSIECFIVVFKKSSKANIQ